MSELDAIRSTYHSTDRKVSLEDEIDFIVDAYSRTLPRRSTSELLNLMGEYYGTERDTVLREASSMIHQEIVWELEDRLPGAAPELQKRIGDSRMIWLGSSGPVMTTGQLCKSLLREEGLEPMPSQ
ncbi:MAG: hypothetical protein WD030_11280 [Pirellulales bacterium]